MAALKIAVAGSSGRMGHAVIESVLHRIDLKLTAALEVPGNAHLGRDAGEAVGSLRIAITADLKRSLDGCDVLIDFTRPEGTLAHLAACRKFGVKMVIGTTGFSIEQKGRAQDGSKRHRHRVRTQHERGGKRYSNFCEMAARVLNEGYDIEIIEAHHRHKVDAPSGTALHMGEIVAQTLGRSLAEVAVYGRQGVTGERTPATIGFATVRGGDIVGDHTVMFAGTGERIEISHKASSRATFAVGALRAARFLANKQNGLFDMQDVLGLR